MMLQVQIPYMPSYNKDQVALVVSEDSNFLRKCQVVLGTPTINQAIWAMKESEMEMPRKPGRVPNTRTSLPTTWSNWTGKIMA